MPALPVLLAHGHAGEPAAPWMWAVWTIAGLASAWSIWAAVRMTIRPGEAEAGHVKRSILDDDAAAATPGARR